MALLPTRMPRKMKIVAGFHGFDTVPEEGEELRERRDLGTRDVQKVVCATFGRWESEVSRASAVAENARDCHCRLAHDVQMVCSDRRALDGAILGLRFVLISSRVEECRSEVGGLIGVRHLLLLATGPSRRQRPSKAGQLQTSRVPQKGYG